MPATIKWNQTRIVKKLAPTQPGALKLARRYGDDLVCVRYRLDSDGRHRYTTVEIVVDQAPTQSLRKEFVVVDVIIQPYDTVLQNKARALGAKWDSKARVWKMSKAKAFKLGLWPPTPRKSS